MAMSFIGKPISLISHSDVRYRGILAGIDPAASTIQLSRVYSMGTEGRRPAHEFIPPVAEPYEYIIFRAGEVKDLSVDDTQTPNPRSVHEDPAVVNAGRVVQQQSSNNPPQPRGQRTNSVLTANSSLQNVERAMGELRQPENGSGGGGGHNSNKNKITVPTTDFDFASSNAKFDKTSAAPDDVAPDAEKEASYNPTKSFFDTLTPGPANMRGRGRGRRQEERNRNVATFGEPGGVGLLGPGAYVGGWGGYSRRGGRGGRGRGQSAGNR
ncbi:hypothetical protein CYLTODRAFT_495117 [Cylindrobasidium torrendii FP15055 ss-10]|uniref:TFG box profile domain-containing protein n=1 Tax=Cylindrobasidium torrendii FP15055 ss-10 TaxID=1314674 RepID=A0A0D7AU19_9AGAR|nr:hypothetical protein CYLTODRAFT_495117 [Cylindrobasidium torrendii FP15055 ss-10]